MEDKEILGLYWNRSENAITETRNKYGQYLRGIAARILRNNEDAEECESDTYVKAWDRLPPDKPDILSAFLGKITRISMRRKMHRSVEVVRYHWYWKNWRNVCQVRTIR